VPILAGTLVFAAFASLGLPGMSGFIGEFMVIVGAIQAYTVYAVIAAFAVILTVGYLLWMVRRVAFGPLNKDRADMKDMTLSEGLSMAPLCVLIVFVGVYPQVLIGVMSTSVEALAHLVGR
jgi:NADH-quinone oxidoreductase subunit M